MQNSKIKILVFIFFAFIISNEFYYEKSTLKCKNQNNSNSYIQPYIAKFKINDRNKKRLN
ncbi:hypothetical protein NDM229_010790 [Acinetobacter bereziniae]|nr:hypothetical protein NDM229_010790 [Acinetobacter bereziniae]